MCFCSFVGICWYSLHLVSFCSSLARWIPCRNLNQASDSCCPQKLLLWTTFLSLHLHTEFPLIPQLIRQQTDSQHMGYVLTLMWVLTFHLAEKTPHRTSGKKTNTCVPLTGWCKLRERTHRKPSRLTDKSKASAESFVVNMLIRTAFISLNWSKFIQTANIKFLVESMCVYVCVMHFSGCVPRKQTVVKRR